MKKYLCVSFVFIALLSSCSEKRTEEMRFEDYPFYVADDLGLIFNRNEIKYRLWSPQAEEVKLNLYNTALGDDKIKEVHLSKSTQGSWMVALSKDHEGKYYTVQVKIEDKWRDEVPGPYAKAVGTNGFRGQLIDPSNYEPEDWDDDQGVEMLSPEDILIYEMHIRDFSIHPESGMTNKGKYLAFAETNTSTTSGERTGVSHLQELGITHVHLLPSFDYLSVDESNLDEPQFNWGYDPQNYNVPEGSYSTNPENGGVRIEEFKTMVKSLHNLGIGVIMDVVYNHTGRVDGLSFEETVPGYYYRQWDDGKNSDASACGNEVASDRAMVRKFMVNSLKYWVEEYHIDGFRFDLMAIHDQETMRSIVEELNKIKPGIFLYGEGWTAADSPLPEKDRALKKYTYKMPGLAAFSDDIRDGIKGHWYDHKSKGYVGGDLDLRESVKFGILGATQHSQIDYSKVNNADTAWAAEPTQCMTYVSCHDNHTLYDKLKIANPEASEEDIRKMHLLSNAIVLTSQGVPFLHAGVDFLRTKDGEENSYKSPDSINQIDWRLKEKNRDIFEKYKSLIQMRKDHASFRLGSAQELQNRINFLESDSSLIAYTISAPDDDEWDEVLVLFNGTDTSVKFALPEGIWQVEYLNSEKESGSFVSGEKDILPFTYSVLYKIY